MHKPSELLAFAEDLGRRAGKITLKYFESDNEIIRKADASPVTVADRETEEFIRTEIEKRFPDHGILGEEYGSTRPDADYQWIVDPIDGTKSFIRRVPLYGVMIGLEHRGECKVGVVNHPPLGVLVSAEKGAGAYRNGQPVRVADSIDDAESLIICTNFSRLWSVNASLFKQLQRDFPLQRTWGDCYGYTMVASGFAQAALDPLANAWDLAALMPIVEEAGGVMTDWKGEATIRGGNCIAATPAIHARIMKMLEHQPARPADVTVQDMI